ncbi:unnamed protein product [Mytilus edulis]|uniref:Uncharacterized protein n=1 Tax=Mytilus edulis TaxID=6550 RepID=A0A8S3PXY5_MYTED|nr:unnamed protein product [Mytilus edulis]
MMETPDCESKDNEDCSDDDVNKGSDDVVNDVPKNKTDTHSELCNKGHTIYSGTLVSVINIVITICICVTTVVILPEYHMNGFHLKGNILRMSDQLESLSTKLKSYCSQTIGPTKSENIYHANYVLQKLNRRLKSELKKKNPNTPLLKKVSKNDINPEIFAEYY